MINRSCDLCDTVLPTDSIEDGGGLLTVFKHIRQTPKPQGGMSLMDLMGGASIEGGGGMALEKTNHDICPACVKGIFDSRNFIRRLRKIAKESKETIENGNDHQAESVCDDSAAGLPPAALPELSQRPDADGDRAQI